jgi:pSer/pThr/pTyr-binding forkhead associated (FHA) protein
MAYLILSDRDGEFARHELREPTIIGRALDCDICVRDILLSRRHCRFEPMGNRWIVADLNSRNGTRAGKETITRHVLIDGEVIHAGKMQICFKAGPFIPPPLDESPQRHVRPADPIEASAGTVHGFAMFDMEEDSRRTGFPVPQPRPPEPASYRHASVHAMVTQIASDQWDQILSEPEFDATAPIEIVDRQRHILGDSQPMSGKVHYLPPLKSTQTRKKLLRTCIAIVSAVGLTSLATVLMRSIW